MATLTLYPCMSRLPITAHLLGGGRMPAWPPLPPLSRLPITAHLLGGGCKPAGMAPLPLLPTLFFWVRVISNSISWILWAIDEKYGSVLGRRDAECLHAAHCPVRRSLLEDSHDINAACKAL